MSQQDEPSAELRALALFAEAIANPATRRDFAGRSGELLDSVLGDDVGEDAKEAFRALFGDLTDEEVRLLARLQHTMVGLSEVHPDLVQTFNPTVSKF
ncbi:MAG: hypothetical protein ACXVUL_14430 [Solirubrobacteraceae bacterium]